NAYAPNGIDGNVPLLGLLDSLSPPASALPATAPGELSGVELSLSGLARLQAASDAFETALQQLQQPGAAAGSSSNAQGAAPDGASLQSQAQSLASAFNALGGSLDALQSSSGSAADVAGLAGGYGDALAQAATASFDNGASTLTTLDQIGLSYQPPSGAGVGTLTLDPAGLAAAFATDPQGTAALLGSAAQSLGTLAGGYGDAGGVIPDSSEAYQSALDVDQLLQGVAGASATAAPSAAELAATQDGASALDASQITAVQQYATASLPLQGDLFNGQLIASLYGGSAAGLGSGGSLSLLA
ncbi:MAG: hypothetical protein ABW005_07360, partial [Burkholderiaceae bacterium]